MKRLWLVFAVAWACAPSCAIAAANRSGGAAGKTLNVDLRMPEGIGYAALEDADRESLEGSVRDSSPEIAETETKAELLQADDRVREQAVAPASERVVDYSGDAVWTRYPESGDPYQETTQHEVAFHFTRVADGSFSPESYVIAAHDGSFYKMFFIHPTVVDAQNGVYLLEWWSAKPDGTPMNKYGLARFFGIPGHWTSYRFEPQTKACDNCDVYVSGGSIFSVDENGKHVMTEDDTYTDSRGRIIAKKTARLVEK